MWGVAFLVFPFALGAAGGHAMRGSLGWIALGIAVFAALLGPHMVRNDLRQDIDQMDILRSYPLRARDAVLGELLAPLAMLTAVEWGLLVVAAGLGVAMGTSATCFAAAG